MKWKSSKPSGLTALKVLNDSKIDPPEHNKVTHLHQETEVPLSCLQYVEQPRIIPPNSCCRICIKIMNEYSGLIKQNQEHD